MEITINTDTVTPITPIISGNGAIGVLGVTHIVRVMELTQEHYIDIEIAANQEMLRILQVNSLMLAVQSIMLNQTLME